MARNVRPKNKYRVCIQISEGEEAYLLKGIGGKDDFTYAYSPSQAETQIRHRYPGVIIISIVEEP